MSVKTKVLQVIFLIGLVTPATAQGVPRPDVPDKINAPASEQVVLVAHASGAQIYSCQQKKNGPFAWTLKAPEAELRDSRGQIIGRHYGGPTWKLNDGSEVVGKTLARVDSPRSDSIPWLLVSVVRRSGTGILSRVTTIQRINTKGGQPPPSAECTELKRNVEAKTSYTAEYYFYAPSK
jgi:hypothetical protein